MSESQTLGSKDKLFIAMAAAMGGGCRTCAEGLHAMAGSEGIAPEEQGRAFLEGLRVRESATKVMRRKAETLVGRELRDEGLSLRAIDAELRAQGNVPRSGKRWHVQTLSNILRGQYLAGVLD